MYDLDVPRQFFSLASIALPEGKKAFSNRLLRHWHGSVRRVRAQHAGGPMRLRLRPRIRSRTETAITQRSPALYPKGRRCSHRRKILQLGFQGQIAWRQSALAVPGAGSRAMGCQEPVLERQWTHPPAAGPSGASKFSGPLDLHPSRRRGRTPCSCWGCFSDDYFPLFKISVCGMRNC
jgi:hypothetical protein